MPHRFTRRPTTRHGTDNGVRQQVAMDAERRQRKLRNGRLRLVRSAPTPTQCRFETPLPLGDFLATHPARGERHAIYAFRTLFNGVEPMVKFGLTNRPLSYRLHDHQEDPQFQAPRLIGLWYFPESQCPSLTRWVVIQLETALKQTLREYRVLASRPKRGGGAGEYTELVEANQEENLLRTLRRLCRPITIRTLYQKALVEAMRERVLF
jgi:hypothetical protein